MVNDGKVYSERQRVLKETLGNALFDLVKSFFSYLFPMDDSGKLIDDKRSYIILTRKGFSLWHAFVLCGLLGEDVPKSDVLISDRYWKKMSHEERALFVKDRNIYIVDDTILTGKDVLSIFESLDSLEYKTRQTVCMVKSIYYNSPEYCTFFSDVTNSERRIQYCKLMMALYKLAIPFTAESTIYHVEKMSRSTIAEWKSWTKENPKLGWYCENSELDFGIAGKADTTFLLHAPSFKCESENILFRGVRVCYRNLSIEEDPEGQFAEVSIVPWVMFSVLNYEKAISYLFKHGGKDSWINKQIVSGDNEYKRNIVHRVISYLFGACVKKDFDNLLNQCKYTLYIEPYQLFGNDLESYHHEKALLNGIHALVSEGCDITDGDNCPYHDLLISKTDYARINKELFESLWNRTNKGDVFISNLPRDIGELESLLCENRELVIDEDTGRILGAKTRYRYPILFYTGNNIGVKALDYVRRSIASFQSSLLTDKSGNYYLTNSLVSGEGSSLAYYKNYDFIWALHQLIFFGAYSSGIENDFATFWNKKIKESKNNKNNSNDKNKEYFRLSEVQDEVVNTLKKITCCLWPPREEIIEYYEKANGEILETQTTQFDIVWDIAREFADSKKK